MSYNSLIWRKAEQYFSAVTMASQKGTALKISVGGDYYLISNLWGEEQKRYTGIHAFTTTGSVKAMTGINLDEGEWRMLTEHFNKVKDVLDGKKVNLSEYVVPILSENVMVKTFKPEWVLNGKVVRELQSQYSEEEAFTTGTKRKPFPGVDYDSDDGEPQLKIQKSYEVPPTDTDLMNMVITAAIHGKIENEMKEHCEACQVKSDTQFDHCHSGNCLDDKTDHIGIYCEPAREKVKVNDLIKVFDKVRSVLGLKPIFAKQLAKSTLIWIPNEKIIDQVHDPLFDTSNMMNLVKEVHKEIIVD